MRSVFVIFLVFVNSLVVAQSKNYSATAITSDLAFFTDVSGMELNKKVKRKTLKRFKSPLMREVATQLLNGSYDKTYRATKYEAYPSNRSLLNQQKTRTDGD